MEVFGTVLDIGRLSIAAQEIELGDGTSPLDHQMLQCSLQFASPVLLPVKAWTAQVTALIHSLWSLFHCLWISRHSFKHIHPRFKTKQHFSLSTLHFTAARGFPCQSCIYIAVTCPLTKCKALLLQGLRTEWQIFASLAKYHINEQQSYSKSWGGRGDKLNRNILPEDHLSALAVAKSFSKNYWTNAVQTNHN